MLPPEGPCDEEDLELEELLGEEREIEEEEEPLLRDE
jgi:hypothetical protein